MTAYITCLRLALATRRWVAFSHVTTELLGRVECLSAVFLRAEVRGRHKDLRVIAHSLAAHEVDDVGVTLGGEDVHDHVVRHLADDIAKRENHNQRNRNARFGLLLFYAKLSNDKLAQPFQGMKRGFVIV